MLIIVPQPHGDTNKTVAPQILYSLSYISSYNKKAHHVYKNRFILKFYTEQLTKKSRTSL